MKKGFTLVELLATIVVLGVIALIAIPTVMDSVATAKEQAALSSIDGLIKAAENYYYKRSSEGNEISEYENILSLIEYKGEQPESGQMRFLRSGTLQISAEYNNKCYRKISDTIEIIDDYEFCLLPPIPH